MLFETVYVYYAFIKKTILECQILLGMFLGVYMRQK